MTNNIEPTSVALIDDHVLLRSGLAGLINSLDQYQVTLEADNGQDFIDKIRFKPAPDIVLLDITMPVMNGYETAHWIRENFPLVKVLVLSMLGNDTAIIRMLKAGARGYILKDSKPSIFREALNQLRDRGYAINDIVSNKILHYIYEAPSSSDPFYRQIDLSEREAVFLKLVCSEKTHKEIASEMFVSPRTVDGYRDNLFEKLGVTSRVGLVLYAIKNGIVSL
jgi:DNA-binding NarL/FixJ family response regulator